jgi:hypothetical protein
MRAGESSKVAGKFQQQYLDPHARGRIHKIERGNDEGVIETRRRKGKVFGSPHRDLEPRAAARARTASNSDR